MGKILKNLTKILMVPAVALSFTGELNGPTSLEVIGNPFSQPNVSVQVGKQSLEWYGSGDVNNDGKIDQSDLDAMNSGTSNYMSDIDGDGTPSTQADKNILAGYIANTIPYLPGHWNELTTRDERKSWILKMRKLEDPRTLANGNWVCADFINQMTFDFYGLSNIEEFIQNEKNTYPNVVHSSKDNAKFNLPMYLFATTNTNGVSHAAAGVLVGDNPLNFKDWLFFNYKEVVLPGDTLKPGDFDMDANHPVTMALRAYLYSPITKTNYFDLVDNIIKFDLNNGSATLNSYKNKILTLNNPNIIKVHVGNLEKLLVDNNGLPADQNFTPEFLKSKGYNSIPDTTKENTTLPINLTYKDRDTIRTSENHYSFFRDFVASIYSGGITKSDSTTQEIEIDNLTPIEGLENTLPKDFRVYQNYPNPFNPSTTIRYELSEAGNVSFTIYDITGRELQKLIKTNISAGTHELNLNMSDYASGVYLLRAQQGGASGIIKLNLIK